jgi:ABC-type oligopeptide transport system substrate-binding subunit
VADLVRRDLIRLGFEPENIEIKIYGGTIIQWPPSEWDLIPTGGWCVDVPDPYEFFLPFSGPAEYDSMHFESAKFEKKINAAARLMGVERDKAFGELDLEMMSKAAPIAPMRTYNNLYLFSNRVDPSSLVYQGVYSDWSIPALALK